MAPPIYFFPGVSIKELVPRDVFNADVLRECGLESVLGDIRQVRDSCSLFELVKPGPGNATGTLLTVTNGNPPARSGYLPDAQDWHEKPAGFDVWVGIDREDIPTPSDLARRKILHGYEIELSDNETWTVPIIRCPFGRESHGQSSLPMDYVYGRDGVAKAVITEEYMDLWRLTGEAWDHWYDRENHASIEFETLLRIGVESLGLSYRYGKIEQTVLRLMNSRNWEDVIAAVLDVPLMIAEMKNRNGKKKASQPQPAQLSSAHGNEETIQDIDPAEASYG